ncbi:DUF2000 domain-containing protein [Streptosporangium roseum]|uniref:DUF2000 domain-containing protein n=1 Tax=Streptosporangium roseum (strain ATCC 12428 / DSM 43021 / JCM 3005 / KCTC 9067 / NCIMB 10171 / NRRL 2505 / NI 9100) TaxID=479432 RepID=D2AXA8_STRRD|nr:DUF2000 domain-containing protein [Streptosporangium roseum]ACZ90835.1 conserved hypothetical protein [Streptosporangium roseum DSM 43021]
MTVLADWIDSLERQTGLPTRQLPVKWVIVIDRDLPRGLQANAAACLAASVGEAVPAILGSAGTDASGRAHAGLPWTGCTVLAAPAATVRRVRNDAAGEPELVVTDMAAIAQQTNVYDEYLAELARTGGEDLSYYAVSLLGPRAVVERLTGRLPLLR